MQFTKNKKKTHTQFEQKLLWNIIMQLIAWLKLRLIWFQLISLKQFKFAHLHTAAHFSSVSFAVTRTIADSHKEIWKFCENEYETKQWTEEIKKKRDVERKVNTALETLLQWKLFKLDNAFIYFM